MIDRSQADLVVLAFDPGKALGFAEVHFTDRRPTVARMSTIDSLDEARNLIGTIESETEGGEIPSVVVGVERNGFHGRRDGAIDPKHWGDSMWCGGEIAGFCRGLKYGFYGFDTFEFSALEWRRAVIGKSNASDAEVKRVLSALVALPARSNAHERDAVGLALYVERRIRVTDNLRGYELKPAANTNLPKPWKPARRRVA